MTRIDVDAGDDGPRLHAFVVGVGPYPFCGERASGPSRSRRILRDLGSLTAPPPSARAVVDWLLANPVDGGGLRLGTVEVLISDAEPVQIEPSPESHVDVERATFDNFLAGFRGWYGRCDSRDDNVALFYFCGHGWGRRGEQLLLLEDVGREPYSLLANCASFADVYAAMEGCRARTQAYFVDACRGMPTELLELEARSGTLMDVPHRTRGARHAPVMFSTVPGQLAWASVGEVTPFTVAMLQTLDGLGARRGRDRKWTVFTEQVGPDLDAVVEWNTPPGDAVQHVDIGGMGTPGGVLRVLSIPPQVPFQLTCAPPEALRAATAVSLHPLDDRLPDPLPVVPDSIGADGRGEVSAGVYRLHMSFDEGFYHETSHVQDMTPPNQTWYLPVEPA